jgi:hypothetical protein
MFVTARSAAVTGSQRVGHDADGSVGEHLRMPATRTEPEPVITTRAEEGQVLLTVVGCLDAATGSALDRSVAAAVAEGALRVDIDLCALTGYTEGGASALESCRRYCRQLAEGLHYVTAAGPGTDAFLSAFERCGDETP